MPAYNDDEEPIYEDELESSDVSPGEKVDLRFNYKRYAPNNLWVELTGSPRYGEDNRRVPGVDVVVILDISATMPGYEKRRYLQKTAMRFFISKLRPIDRLSVVVFLNNNAERLCPLRLMRLTITEDPQEEDLISQMTDAKEDVELLMNYFIVGRADSPRDIAACLREALQVLDDRTHSEGRKPAIILLSGSDATEDAVEVPMGDVPLHVLALGGDFTPHVLKEIASKSSGGTFSVLDLQKEAHYDSINNLRSAFSQCLGQLFTVAVKDLKLILTPPMVKLDQGQIQNDQGKSDLKVETKLTMEVVGRRLFRQIWSDSAPGSITLSLGDLYCQETRKFFIALHLPWYDHDKHSGTKESEIWTELSANLSDDNEIYHDKSEDNEDEVYDDKSEDNEDDIYKPINWEDSLAESLTYGNLNCYKTVEETYDESEPAVLRITYSYSGCLEPYNTPPSVIPIKLQTGEIPSGAPPIPFGHLRRVQKEKEIAEAHRSKFKSIHSTDNHAATSKQTPGMGSSDPFSRPSGTTE